MTDYPMSINISCGLFPKWICDINPLDLRFQSVTSDELKITTIVHDICVESWPPPGFNILPFPAPDGTIALWLCCPSNLLSSLLNEALSPRNAANGFLQYIIFHVCDEEKPILNVTAIPGINTAQRHGSIRFVHAYNLFLLTSSL